jgi:hypothetical protein
MSIGIADFVTALGLFFVLEGLIYALFPGPLKNAVSVLLAQSEGFLRVAGLVAIMTGVIVIWFVRG